MKYLSKFIKGCGYGIIASVAVTIAGTMIFSLITFVTAWDGDVVNMHHVKLSLVGMFGGLILLFGMAGAFEDDKDSKLKCDGCSDEIERGKSAKIIPLQDGSSFHYCSQCVSSIDISKCAS